MWARYRQDRDTGQWAQYRQDWDTGQTGQGHWTVGTVQTGTLYIRRQETGHERGTGQDRVQGLLKSEQYITETLNRTELGH